MRIGFLTDAFIKKKIRFILVLMILRLTTVGFRTMACRLHVLVSKEVKS